MGIIYASEFDGDVLQARMTKEELEYCENDAKIIEENWKWWIPNNRRRMLGMCTRRCRAMRKARRNQETITQKRMRWSKSLANFIDATTAFSNAMKKFSSTLMDVYSKVRDVSIVTDLSESEIFSRVHSMLEESPDKTFDDAISDILESERRG